MTDLLSSFGDLFSFILDSMSDIANFFTTNLIGQLILGVSLFSVAWVFLSSFIDKFHH